MFELAYGSGTITTLASFAADGSNGANPVSLIADAGGNLFGAALGGGTLQGAVTSNSLLKVGAGQLMTLAGDVTNNVGIRVLGTAASPAELDVSGVLRNDSGATLYLRNATLSTNGGLNNGGSVQISGPVNNIFGAVTNNAGATTAVAAGSTAYFSGTVTDQSTIQVGANGQAIFFGLVTGAGSFTGSGLVDIEATLHVGNSPAQVTYSTAMTFGSRSKLSLELAGTTPGTCDGPGCAFYGQVIFNNNVSLNGPPLVDFHNGSCRRRVRYSISSTSTVPTAAHSRSSTCRR